MKIFLPTILIGMIALDIEIVLSIRRVWAKESALEQKMKELEERYKKDLNINDSQDEK